MTTRIRQRKAHFKNVKPTHPDIKSYNDWLEMNRQYYVAFRRWLKAGGYSDNTLHIYSVATRLALGLLDKPYWAIDPHKDIDFVRQHINQRQDLSSATKGEYWKGLQKFREFILWKRKSKRPPRKINWDYYTQNLPDWLTDMVKEYLAHRTCSWPEHRRHLRTRDLLSRLTAPLRWMTSHFSMETIADFTPKVWFAYSEYRLSINIQPVTINVELSCIVGFLHFLADEGYLVCERIFRVPFLEEGWRMPKDVPVSQLKILLREIQKEIESEHGGKRLRGLCDHAWVLLMLHCGLRTLEVRRIMLDDIDWERRCIRIEQAKGFKDRFVWMTDAVITAIQAYIEVRGPMDFLPNELFVYRHKPLSNRYCQVRLRTYYRRCGVKVSPHQLRHSCATLLLNAGAPVTTVQAILGHKHVDTTLRYARLYDGTVAQHYFKAMERVEDYLEMDGNVKVPEETSYYD